MAKINRTEIEKSILEDGTEVTTYRMHLANGRIICQDRWIEYDENNAVSCISPFYLWLANESEAE